jgi:hypothetical protein
MMFYHLHLQAGTTFVREFFYTNSDGSFADLDGYTATFQVRPTASSATLVLETNPEIDFETSVVTLALTAGETATLSTGSVYAIELSNETTTFVLSQGQLVVSPEVVR